MKRVKIYVPNETIEMYTPNIGQPCAKYSGNPFKSGNKVNTISGVIYHPKVNIPAYTFEEDESYVECRRCTVALKNKIGQKSVERVGIVGLEILSELGRRGHKDAINDDFPSKGLKYIELCGVSVKRHSQRYSLFRKNISCVNCGITGKFFAIEKSDRKAQHYHLNLYAINEAGEEVLMTKDHVIPESKGGKSNMGNYQTMCTICNAEKGAELIDECCETINQIE